MAYSRLLSTAFPPPERGDPAAAPSLSLHPREAWRTAPARRRIRWTTSLKRKKFIQRSRDAAPPRSSARICPWRSGASAKAIAETPGTRRQDQQARTRKSRTDHRSRPGLSCCGARRRLVSAQHHGRTHLQDPRRSGPRRREERGAFLRHGRRSPRWLHPSVCGSPSRGHPRQILRRGGGSAARRRRS